MEEDLSPRSAQLQRIHVEQLHRQRQTQKAQGKVLAKIDDGFNYKDPTIQPDQKFIKVEDYQPV